MTDQELAAIYTSNVKKNERYKNLLPEQKKYVDAIAAFLSTGGPTQRLDLENPWQIDRMLTLAEKRA